MRLLDSSARVIEASEACAARRPVRASRQFQRVSSWLCEATARLEHAVHGLRETTDEAARSPERAAEAPGLLIDATARWIDVASRIAALSERLEDSSGRLLESVKDGSVPIDSSGSARDAAIVPRLLPARGRLSFIFLRRQPCICTSAAEGARRIFRGRAPPRVSNCSL